MAPPDEPVNPEIEKLVEQLPAAIDVDAAPVESDDSVAEVAEAAPVEPVEPVVAADEPADEPGVVADEVVNEEEEKHEEEA